LRGAGGAIAVVDSARTGCSAAESVGCAGGAALERQPAVRGRSRTVAFIVAFKAVVAGKQTPKPVNLQGFSRAERDARSR
jgi:hypothetical protein